MLNPPGICLDPLLPPQSISAGMEERDDQQVPPSTTKNSEYGNRRNRARRTFLFTIGNCRGSELMRATKA
jgi:hypothetical protein